MSKTNYRISIVYPFDPLGKKVGGIETFIKGFIRHAPEDIQIELIGITSDKITRPVKKKQRLKIGRKEFEFLPLLFQKEENKKTLIPLSLRFSLALMFSKLDFSNKILNFHRFEPGFLFMSPKFTKVAFVHTNVCQQLDRQKSEVSWKYFPAIYKWMEAHIICSFDYIYVINKDTLGFYCSQYPEYARKISFSPVWVDTEIFFPREQSNLELRQNLLAKDNIPLNEKWILFVGRLQEVKAPLRLVETFSEYHKKNKESCLLIIGEGNLKQKMKKRTAELGLTKSVYFLGTKNERELARFYGAADVMLLTSNFEGMPMCVLEALGSGLAVVSTNVGEIKRVIKNGFSGEVVESFAPEIISRSVEKVLENPDIYSKDNCIKAVSEYTPQKVLKPVYEMMRRLYDKDM